jgi:hypothetical protein
VHAAATRVVVYSALSEAAHAAQAASSLGVEAFREYGDALRQDAAAARQRQQAAVQQQPTQPPPPQQPPPPPLQLAVRHLPMHVAALDSGAFVLPAGSAAAALAT